MQYNFWGCRRQKPWFWFLTVSQLVPTNIENVPGWFSMSHNVILVLRMQYYFWGCSITSEDAVQFLRRQKAKTLILMSRSVPTCPNKYKNVPVWFTMSHNVILVLRMQYYFWGCSKISEDAEGKNIYFDVSQGPNMSQRGSKGSRMLLMHSNYWKCMRMHEYAWGCTRMHEDVQGCSLVGAQLFNILMSHILHSSSVTFYNKKTLCLFSNDSFRFAHFRFAQMSSAPLEKNRQIKVNV